MKNKDLFVSVSKKVSIIVLLFIITALCLAASLSGSNTFVVHDGENEYVYSSTATSAKEFIEEIGLVIGEDKYFDMPENLTKNKTEIYIKNKNVLKLKIDGEVKTLYALNENTLADVLAENEIALNAEDIVTLPLEQNATDGLEFEVIRVSHHTAEEYKEIPFTTEKRPSASLNKGNTKVITNGEVGSKKFVYDVRTENGKEVSRTLLSETTVKEPVTKIVEYGTREVNTSGTVKTWSGETLQYKKVINMTATAYTTERTSDKITATGKVARVGLVAVDPRVIPLGSKLYIVAANGKSWCYGVAVAADTGVRGNKIDLFFDTYKECINFGRKKATVYILK